jgi:tRNA-dihydrouridine synthase
MSISIYEDELKKYDLYQDYAKLIRQFQSREIDEKKFDDQILQLLEVLSTKQAILKPVIIGNGDVNTHEDGITKAQESGVDGIMVGRGIFHNINLFSGNSALSISDKLNLLQYHLELWQQTWQDQKNYQALKKYFKIYIQGFDNASNLREKLMNTKNTQEAIEIIKTFTAL